MAGTTPAGFLYRLKHGITKAEDQERLKHFYQPMIRRWLSHVHGLRDEANAEDVVQEVFLVVVRRIPEFDWKGKGSFRGWLREITRRCVLDSLKEHGHQLEGEHVLAQLEDPTNELDRWLEQEHARDLLHKHLAVVERDFGTKSVQAFIWIKLECLPAEQVARDLGMTVGAVRGAGSRVLKRLREELGDFMS
ncbi:MAG TPA: sigma-70 family RNA polymerase sigma factor [Gemmataceae bacterium]|nr:sigma-70 family RNA polymerase sigma factor [Gemmataceae bacterium]